MLWPLLPMEISGKTWEFQRAEAAKFTIKVSLLHVEGQHRDADSGTHCWCCEAELSYIYYIILYIYICIYIYMYLTCIGADRLPDILRLQNCIPATVQFTWIVSSVSYSVCVAHGDAWLKSLVVGLVVLFENILLLYELMQASFLHSLIFVYSRLVIELSCQCGDQGRFLGPRQVESF